MKEKYLQIPLREEDILNLRLGELVYLNGKVFTARTLFHLKAVNENKVPDLDFTQMNVMVHMGPMMKKSNDWWEPVSLEPTTSMRVEKYAADVIPMLNLRAVLGKGSMGEKTADAMKKFKCVHLAKVGIYGNILAKKVTNVIGVHNYEELGPIECTWVFEVKDFGPFLVDIDAEGNNFFYNINKTAERKLKKKQESLSNL